MRLVGIRWLLCAAIALAGCERRPPPGELAALRDEARRADEQARARGELVLPRQATLEIRTASASDRRVLSFDRLDAMATDAIESVGPAPDTGYHASHAYRGIRLSRLVGDLDGGADDDIVVFGADGFHSTVRRDDVIHTPILLALERDGQKIPASLGGPLLVALPLATHPELAQRYGENAWCFYVTGMATGRPLPRLRIDGVVREPSFLREKGLVTRKQSVRFRMGWPPGEVVVTGPRLADLVARGSKTVKIWSMGRDDAHATIVTEDDLRACDPIVVVGDAPEERAIPIRLGGPALLAPLPGCKARWAEEAWPAFLDTLEGRP